MSVARVVDRSRRPMAALVASVLVAGGLLSGAAEAQTCLVQPLLRNVTIGQGLPYSNGAATNSVLVGGKSALVRFYFSEQECADKDFLLDSANLVLNGSTSNPIRAQQTLVPGAPISNHISAPAINSTGDPVFLVPASRLSGTMSFRVDITFTPRGGSALPASYSSLGGVAIQRKVHTATAPMRILAVPMGDGRYLFPDAKNNQVPQLSATGIENATAGFTGLTRTFPVADGTGTLGLAGGGGVRYFLNESGLVNVNSSLGDGGPNKDATYCDGGFSAVVVPQLADFRLNFNTIGNAEPAARVLGLLDEGLSDPGLSCSRGRAVAAGREAWVRTLTGRTAALMAMEEAHNFGSVPDSRDGASDMVAHSTQDQADQFDPSFVNRGYNLASGRYIESDRTALKYFETGWDDNNVLLEKFDWDMIFCKQGGPPTTNTDCSVSGSSGAVPAVAPVTALMGSTNFSAGGTSIFDSFTANGFPTEEPVPSSRLRMKELASNGSVLSVRGVPFASLNTLHQHDGNNAEQGFSFGLTIPTHPDAAAWQLVDANDGEVLAGASKSAPPVIQSMTVTGGFPQGCLDCGSALGREQSFNPDLAERIDFESGYVSNGDTITDHYASQGVIFDDPGDGTMRIVGDCRLEGAPCRAGFNTFSPTHSLFNNPQCAAGCPNSGPVTMRFPVPVQKVGMYVGGGSTRTITGPDAGQFVFQTTATLNLYNSNDELIGTTSRQPGDNVDAFIGFDAGESAIARATLDYSPPADDNSDASEFIDDLMFEGFAQRGQSSVEAVVTDPDGIDTLSATWFADCGDVTVPIAVNQPVNTDEGGSFFSYAYDSENICANGGQATLSVRVDDGYSTDTETTMVASSANHAPVPAISAPAEGVKILEHAAIKSQGAGNDFENGALPGTQLSWTITGPGVSQTGTGTDLNLPAPANGWTPGDYVATLTATDSDGNSQSTTSEFRVLTDADNDGVTETAEACAGGSDTDPFDNENDGDKDGYRNRDDSDPCTAETKYDAELDFDPDTLNLPSVGQTVKFDVRLHYRNVADVIGPSVKIAKIDGVKVEKLTPSAGPPGGIPNLSWEVKNGVGTAKFDRRLLENLLLANGMHGKKVVLTLRGQGATLVGLTTRSWDFEGSDAPRVKRV